MKIPFLLPFITCAIGLSITATIFSVHKKYEKEQERQFTMSNNQSLLSHVKINIDENLLLVDTLRALFDASTTVSRTDFKVFSHTLLELSPSIQALEWVPKVLHKDREKFRQMAIEDGFSDYQIVEPAPDGTLVRSGERSVYYPVYYVEPFEGNEVVMGLAPPNHVIRLDAIARAAKSGRPALSSPFILTQERIGGKMNRGVLIFAPVYKDGVTPETEAEKMDKLTGLVLMVLRVSDLVKYSLATSNVDHAVAIYDVTDNQEDLVFQSAENTVDSSYMMNEVIEVAGRKWKICVYPKHVYSSGFLSGSSWAFLLFGLGLTVLFTIMIFQLIYRRQLVEGLVEDKTREVRELSSAMEKTVEGVSVINRKGNYSYVNEAFAEITGFSVPELMGQNWENCILEEDRHLILEASQHALDHEKSTFEVRLTSKTGDLLNVRMTLVRKSEGKSGFNGYYCFMSDVTKRKQAELNLMQANEELEEFAYRTSHDLKSPLVSSIGLLNIVESSIQSQDYDIALESAGHIGRSLKSLDVLVDEILTLTKMKYSDEPDQVIDIFALVDDSLRKLSHLPNYDRLDIRTRHGFTRTLMVKSSRIKLITENLISNAIKYQDTSKDDSYIHISSYSKDDKFILEVRDNGLGIPEEFREKMFRMFQRFHPKDSYGSGLGLYMMKKSADIINADLVVEHLEQGTMFQLIIPINTKED